MKDVKKRTPSPTPLNRHASVACVNPLLEVENDVGIHSARIGLRKVLAKLRDGEWKIIRDLARKHQSTHIMESGAILSSKS